jgi:hypothetical protein
MANKRQPKAAQRARLEQERRERAARRKRMAFISAGLAVAVIVAAIVLIAAFSGSGKASELQQVSGRPSVDPNSLRGILTGPAPWPNNSAYLAARLSADALPPLSATEGVVLHIHQHIDIFIRGHAAQVPANIGIVTSPSVLFAPIHTHDATGIIHVESPVVRDFSLGEFFDVWGVRFTSTCIGGYCDGGNERLQVFASGKVVTFDPRRLKLIAHEEIVVTFGSPDQIPTPYPITYRFPVGD